MPHSVVTPQLHHDLGSDINSETPFLLRLTSWEVECFGTAPFPPPPSFPSGTPGSGFSDQGPSIFMFTHPQGT